MVEITDKLIATQALIVQKLYFQVYIDVSKLIRVSKLILVFSSYVSKLSMTEKNCEVADLSLKVADDGLISNNGQFMI